MDLSYDKSIWNIKKDFKVPQNIEVSLGFTALHETNPGLYNNGLGDLVFGTAEFEKKGNEYRIKGDIVQENIRKIFKSAKDLK